MTADILILGAGIGGYETFRSLAKRLKKFQDRRITIVDKNNYFTFVPMLHEAATGSIEPTHCAIPLRALVAGTPHTFCKASIEKIDPA
ncbi:MAG: NADH dehydrogenase, partial [Candidatus Magasanikbacteria bacterium GW2011_GWE2_42_7]